MKRRNSSMIGFLFLALAVLPEVSVHAQPVDPNLKMFFAGVVGDQGDGRRKILLRWYGLEGSPPFTDYAVYCKPGPADASAEWTRITTTQPIRNVPTIRSIFERAGEDRVRNDMLQQLASGCPTCVTPTLETYAETLIEILDATGETAEFRRTMLVQSNYGIALVQGVGYIDRKSPGLYTYELHAVNVPGSTADYILGRITIDANQVTQLPAPQALSETFIDRRNHERVYLKWDLDANWQKHRALSFGFDVYRFPGPLEVGQTFEQMESMGLLTKLNTFPVIILSPTPDGTEDGHNYYFVDDNLTGATEVLTLVPGMELTYWVCARDLLGQRGAPSNPYTAVVQDDEWPDPVSGLQCQTVQVGSQDRLQLVWNPNTDDVVGYRVYRFALYEHVYKENAFPNVDGLAEGYVASVPHATGLAKLRFTDSGPNINQHLRKNFYYQVRPYDAWGNLGPFSAPTRCILYNRFSPDPPRWDCILTAAGTCFVTADVKKPVSNDGREINFRFLGRHTHDAISKICISIGYDFGQQTVYVLAGEISFASSHTGEFRQTLPVGSQLQFRYRIEAKDRRGIPCATTTAVIDTRLTEGAARDHVLGIEPGVEVREIEKSERVPGRRPEHRPDFGPLGVIVTTGPEISKVRFYRSVDGNDYAPICDVTPTVNIATCMDPWNPNVGGIVCYGARTVDIDGNQSAMSFFPNCIEFIGGVLPAPLMKAATPGGTIDAPVATFNWWGPKSGVESYDVLLTETGILPQYPIVVPVNQINYDPDTGYFSYTTGKVDGGGTPLDPYTTYQVSVVANAIGGATRISDVKKFNWNWDPFDEALQWPARPVPGEMPYFTGINAKGETVQPVLYLPDVGNLLLVVERPGSANFPGGELEFLKAKPPFIVYRQRTDLPNRPFIQVSPLIESIRVIPEGKHVDDPWFYQFERLIWYLDTVNVVRTAKYRYVIVSLTDRGEISQVWGPTSEVTVATP